MEASGEEARQPEDQAVAEDRARGGAERQQPEAGRPSQRPGHGEERWRDLARTLVEAAARRLGDEPFDEQRRGQAGEADDQEGRAPVEMAGDPAAEEDAERRADRDAEREEGERPAALLPRVEIRHQGIRESDPAVLAD